MGRRVCPESSCPSRDWEFESLPRRCGISSVGRTLDCGSKCRGFKSHMSPFSLSHILAKDAEMARMKAELHMKVH